MNPLKITAIQRGCVYDGTGVRTTIFLKDCIFSCPWCCNPETLSNSPSLFIDENKCLQNHGIESNICTSCVRNNGDQEIAACPLGVAKKVYSEYNIESLEQIILKDKMLYDLSGGGVTFSGGEPLLHLDQLLPLLKRLKENNVRCAIETSLYYKESGVIKQATRYIQEWIVDLKLQPVNYKHDYSEIIIRNLNILRSANAIIKFRLVYIDGLNTNKCLEYLQIYGITSIEVIKCHSLAESKYRKLKLNFQSYIPSDENYNDFVSFLNKNGVITNKLTL